MEFGPYELLDRISSGGMADVYRARSTGAGGFRKNIAIKQIRPSLGRDKKFVNMFIEEARLMAKLSHGNIAQVFDFGVIQGRYYLAMELVDGFDLASIYERLSSIRERIPVAIAIHIAAEVCQGLHYAHTKADEGGTPLAIVHRDVSPQNILVSFDGAVKLIDFGIAKVRQRATETTQGKIKGKSGYMSPEQVRGVPIDQRSDLFGVGTVLHEMLTGKPLFYVGAAAATMRRVLHALIEAPSAENSRVSVELDAIVLRALERPLEARFQSAESFYTALMQYARVSNQALMQRDISRWMRSNFSLSTDDLKKGHRVDREAATVTNMARGAPVRGGAAKQLLDAQVKAPLPEPSLTSEVSSRRQRTSVITDDQPGAWAGAEEVSLRSMQNSVSVERMEATVLDPNPDKGLAASVQVTPQPHSGKGSLRSIYGEGDATVLSDPPTHMLSRIEQSPGSGSVRSDAIVLDEADTGDEQIATAETEAAIITDDFPKPKTDDSVESSLPSLLHTGVSDSTNQPASPILSVDSNGLPPPLDHPSVALPSEVKKLVIPPPLESHRQVPGGSAHIAPGEVSAAFIPASAPTNNDVSFRTPQGEEHGTDMPATFAEDDDDFTVLQDRPPIDSFDSDGQVIGQSLPVAALTKPVDEGNRQVDANASNRLAGSGPVLPNPGPWWKWFGIAILLVMVVGGAVGAFLWYGHVERTANHSASDR